MSSQYKKFIKLIAKWPLDASKGERDLGKAIRDQVRIVFESSDRANLNTEECNKQYTALNKIADNQFKKKYKRINNSSATGLSTEECNTILSDEILTYLKEENKGFFSKIFGKEAK